VRRASLTIGAALLVAGCGNFFPNPDNVVLPSGIREYEVDCGPVPRGECEARARRLVEQKRIEQPAARITKIRLDDDAGSYTITYADGSAESLIVN
jgi:hypothetical protein